MSWPVFAIAAYFLLAIQFGARGLLEIGQTGIEPSLLLIFMVFLASVATSQAAMWSALVLGLLVDFTIAYRAGDAAITILGPHALGYALGAFLVLQLRSLVYRRHPLTMLFLTALAGIVANLLAVFLISIRHLIGSKIGFYVDFTWSAMDELYLRFFVVLYSAVVAVPLGWILHSISSIFGVPAHHHHHRVVISR